MADSLCDGTGEVDCPECDDLVACCKACDGTGRTACPGCEACARDTIPDELGGEGG